MSPEHAKEFDETLTRLYEKLDTRTKTKAMDELEKLFYLVGYYMAESGLSIENASKK